jgi:hypothetical protein
MVGVTPLPVQQRHAEPLLEAGDAAAEAGLRDIAGFGGFDEVAVLDGGPQMLELLDFHGRPSMSGAGGQVIGR